MSLNGLDEVEIIEAHEAAAAEPGGWFLLKYASRDEVELLGRGTGGVVEIRTTIAEYDDESPLYGFLRYRRRNVIIKYLPEDCSRLIRARVAVHFNAVCERFSPYDTIFDISTAAELRDTKLSAACSLHAASGSTSSSTSSRRRHLGEIVEEDEEEQRALRRQSAADSADANRPSTPVDKSLPPDPAALPSDLASSPEPILLSTTTTATSGAPNFSAFGGEGPTSPARSLDPDTYNYSPYPTGKPRVKLGPRPSNDATIRPQTAGNFKPVSTIPAGIKLFGKGAKKGKGKDREKDKARDKDRDQGSHPTSLSQEGSYPPIHADTVPFVIPEDDATTDRLLASPIPAPAPTRQTISPEKARLMKAMQLREKRRTMAALKEQQRAAAAIAADDEKTRGDDAGDAVREKASDDIDAIEEGDEELMEDREDAGEDKTKEAGENKGKEEDGEAEEDEAEAEEPQATDNLDVSTSSALTDTSAAQELAPPAHLDESSEITQAESRAESPVVVSSETDQSTMASSLSELTDETVQGKGGRGHDGDSEKVQNRNEGDLNAAMAAAAIVKVDAPGDKPGNVEIVEISERRGSADSEGQNGVAPGQDNPEPERDDSGELSVPKLMVPKSKFSTQDLAGASKGGSSSPSTVSSLKFEAEQKPEEMQAWEDEDDAQETCPLGIQTEAADIRQKGTSPDDSDVADDASTVQETAPAPASRPPSLCPPASNTSLRASVQDAARAAPNTARGANLTGPAEPSHQPSRSMSSGAAFLHKVNQQQQQSTNTVIVKPIVGSSISQRIKALEMLSASSGDQRPTSRERPSATFHAVQKREGASVADRAKSLKNAPPPAPPLGPSPDLSRVARRRAPSLTNSLSKFDLSRGRTEPSSATPKQKDDHSASNRNKTPAAADEQAVGSEGSSRTSMSSEREAKNGKRNSMTRVKEFIKEHRKSTTVSADMQQAPSSAGSPGRPPSSSQQGHGSGPRRSMSSRRSSISRELDPSSPIDDERGDRSMSRAGRFMRRLSNFPSARGKGSVSLSSPVAEEASTAAPKRSLTINAGSPAAAAAKPSTSSGAGPSTAAVSDMGDVNVQFPDNLLWKRRNLSLDAQGFLILSASSQNGKVAVGTKRYHLSEFRQPYTPDLEVQELPNSVCLDFAEGGGIQIACEDRLGQIHVLSVLRDAHHGHSTFGQ